MGLSKQQHFDRRIANKYTNYTVKQESELMAFLMTAISGISRTKAKELLSQKMVYVDHQITTQYNTILKPGQLVQIAKRGNKHELTSRYVKVIYEDAFILVVEKKEGILTNAMPGVRQTSVKSILDDYIRRRSRTLTAHTIHRLDRETSGLLIFAKRRDVQEMFVENWKQLVSDRRYVAVVEGDMEKDKGSVMSWLKDNKMFVTYSSTVDNGGKRAITNYSTIKRANGYSLMELKLDTGRKNQIRVHMQDLHHSIAGDYKYGALTDPIGRVCLHAFRLEFTHPITGEHLKFETPYPAAFTKLLEA